MASRPPEADELLTPAEVAALFRDWIETTFPDRAAHVMNRVRELHGGRDYDPAWGRRMRGEGLWARLIAQRFDKACTRLGLAGQMPPLRSDLFAPPFKTGNQLSLF